MSDELYACEFCSNIFDMPEEREACRINCHLDCIWHIYDEYEGNNFWTQMSMQSYYHLTVEDIEKYYEESVKDIGSGGNYI